MPCLGEEPNPQSPLDSCRKEAAGMQALGALLHPVGPGICFSKLRTPSQYWACLKRIEHCLVGPLGCRCHRCQGETPGYCVIALKAHTGQRTNKCLVKGPLDIQPLPGLLSKRFSDVFFPDWLGAAYKKNHVLFEAAKGCQVDPKWCFTSPLGHDEERVLAMLAGRPEFAPIHFFCLLCSSSFEINSARLPHILSSYWHLFLSMGSTNSQVGVVNSLGP